MPWVHLGGILDWRSSSPGAAPGLFSGQGSLERPGHGASLGGRARPWTPLGPILCWQSRPPVGRRLQWAAGRALSGAPAEPLPRVGVRLLASDRGSLVRPSHLASLGEPLPWARIGATLCWRNKPLDGGHVQGARGGTLAGTLAEPLWRRGGGLRGKYADSLGRPGHDAYRGGPAEPWASLEPILCWRSTSPARRHLQGREGRSVPVSPA